MNVGLSERNQQDANNPILISNFHLNMFRAWLCPSSGEQDRLLLNMVFLSFRYSAEHHM